MNPELALKGMETCNMLKTSTNDMKVKEDYSCLEHLTPQSDGDICFIQQLIGTKRFLVSSVQVIKSTFTVAVPGDTTQC